MKPRTGTGTTTGTGMEATTPSTSSTPTKQYKLVKGTHTTWENGAHVSYRAGTENDTLSLTQEQAESLGARVQPVTSTMSEGDSQPQAGQYMPSAAKVSEVEADTEQGEEQLTGAPQGKGTIPAMDAVEAEMTGGESQEMGSESGDEGSDEAEESSDVEAEDFSYIGDQHWKTVIKQVQTVDDPEMLTAMREAEVAGKNRAPVIDAIDERLGQLG